MAIGLAGMLTKSARAKHGELDAEEMFTFVPALKLGGADALENVQKVKLMPQLDLLSQLHETLDYQG